MVSIKSDSSVESKGYPNESNVLTSLVRDHIKLLWLQGQGCSGCTVSLLQAEFPGVVDILLSNIPFNKVNLEYHPTIMFLWGEKALELIAKPPQNFILIVEGAIPTRDGGIHCLIQISNDRPTTLLDYIKNLASKALAVIAVGTCASFGGIPKASPNPTDAKSVADVLGQDYKSKLGLPVINIPGCPPHPDWIIGTLTNVLLFIEGKAPPLQLDKYNRPIIFFNKTIHENCHRAGYFSEGEFAKKFGEKGCLLLLGCKGPVAYGDCVERKWNGRVNACPLSGSVCIGCTDPDFPDIMSPFIYYPPKPIPAFIPPPTLTILLYGYGVKKKLEEKPWERK